MRVKNAFTLVEVLVVVLMLGAMAAIAVPRLSVEALQRGTVEIEAWKIVAGLRRTRSLAILHAATHPRGFALIIQTMGLGTEYEIVDLGGNTVVDSYAVDADVSIAGRRRFEFSPLGALEERNDPTLTVSATGRTFTIRVTPSTGAVRCVEN